MQYQDELDTFVQLRYFPVKFTVEYLSSLPIEVFNDAAKDGVLNGAAHIQFPGLGHLQKEKKGFEWVPVNFTQMH